MSRLYDEIHEQPEVIARLISAESPRVARIATELHARPIRYVLIAGRGTSDHAAIYAKYLFGGMLGLPVALAAPSLYTLYRRPPRTGDDALVIGISQSGESPDIVAVLAEARRQGATTLAVTNEPDSPLARASEFTIPCHAGPELSIAATKTYTAQLTALAMLVASWTQDKGMQDDVRQLPEALDQALALAPESCVVAQRYRSIESAVVLGRGYNYATAFELALKIKELTYLGISAYSPADFRHGPIAMIEPGFPVIVIAPQGASMPDLAAISEELVGRGADVIAIADEPASLPMASVGLWLATSLPEWLSPIAYIVPGQLLALNLALARGLDPDQPRGLHKVTKTL